MTEKTRLKEAATNLIGRVERIIELVNWQDLIELADIISHARRTFVIGAGRSGLVARSFGMRLMQAGFCVFVPGETITPSAGKGDILVAVTCTGQTGFTCYLARRAKELRAGVVVLTTEEESKIAKEADKIVAIPVPEEDFLLKATLFEHTASICLDALFDILSKRRKTDLEMFKGRHANLE